MHTLVPEVLNGREPASADYVLKRVKHKSNSFLQKLVFQMLSKNKRLIFSITDCVVIPRYEGSVGINHRCFRSLC